MGTDDWTPILYDDTDDFPRSVAALRRYDVLLVNPIRDGLNLVAKEGALVNERDGLRGALAGGRGVGRAGQLRRALPPFDVGDTAAALERALSMEADERAERSQRLRAAAAARTPGRWLADQVSAAG